MTLLLDTDEHILVDVALPKTHHDPFDRLLINVAAFEQLVLLTADGALIELARLDPRLPVRSV